MGRPWPPLCRRPCFAFSFVVVKPIQSKQDEVSLACYLRLHHKRLYYFSTYCTHENSIMAFMATL